MRKESALSRLSTVAATAVLAALGILGVFASPSGAEDPDPAAPVVRVVKVSGLLDPVVADFLDATFADLDAAETLAVVLRVDSTGSVVSDEWLTRLARAIHDAPVPVIGWVGPAGSSAQGGTAQLLAAADAVGLAPGSDLGRIGEVRVPRQLWSDAFWDQRDVLRDTLLGPVDAAAAGVAVEPDQARVLRDVLLQIPGFEAGDDDATPVQFSELSTSRTVLHTFASPAVAVLLLAIGLSLLLFEFYTAGVGVGGLVGAGCVLYAFYGLGVLGVRPIAVAAVVVAMIAFAVDVQTGVPRLYTAVGAVLFAVGLLFLFDGVATPWPATIGSIVGVVVFMVFGMPAMTRSRFASPVVGRRWLVGERGLVVEALRPQGVVRIDGALWAARSDDPVPVGAAVRVVDTEGVLCRVESMQSTSGGSA